MFPCVVHEGHCPACISGILSLALDLFGLVGNAHLYSMASLKEGAEKKDFPDQSCLFETCLTSPLFNPEARSKLEARDGSCPFIFVQQVQ